MIFVGKIDKVEVYKMNGELVEQRVVNDELVLECRYVYLLVFIFIKAVPKRIRKKGMLKK